MDEIKKDIEENYILKGKKYFAEKYKITENRVQYLARELKATNNKRISRERARENQDEIISLYNNGNSISDISFKMKISWHHIKEILIENNIKIKRVHDYKESYKLDTSFF